MTNPLTGDCDAVLQVSEATVNRLVASMHQNAWANPKTPSFPHSVGLRLGDGVTIDGVKGTAWAQVGVPRIELIHESTDRFWLEAGVRIRYRPDPGSEPLPEFIHGTVRAQYAMEDIDPNCPGWKSLARDYVWIRVVEDTVSFSGTAEDDLSDLATVVQPLDSNVVKARITRQLVELLSSTFEPTPQKLPSQFRRGSMKCLRQPFTSFDVGLGALGRLEFGGSGVAIAVAMTPNQAPGPVASVHNVVLSGRDFAVAVSREPIMRVVDAALEPLRQLRKTVRVRVSGPWGSETYHITAHVNSVTASWVPDAGGGFATIVVKARGQVDADTDLVSRVDIDIDQRLIVGFDAANEQLTIVPGPPPFVAVTGGGPIVAEVREDIRSSVTNGVSAAVSGATSTTVSLSRARADLDGTLTTLDANAGARFDDAAFSFLGVIFLGSISVSPRKRPVAQFAKIDDDSFSALPSWIPGGRIDEFHWHWKWFDRTRPQGQRVNTDRFLLRRPRGQTTRFGISHEKPLPGLDGGGYVCLTVKGVVVNTVTGALVPVMSGERCTRFGFSPFIDTHQRLRLREYSERNAVEPPGPIPEERLVEVARQPLAVGSASNTLVLYLDDRLTEQTAVTLGRGIAGCRRDDAGLLVVMLFRDGNLAGANDDVIAIVDEMVNSIEAPIIVSEDVGGGWSEALAIEAGNVELSWRLVTPGGGVVWMHDGRLDHEELSQVLDHSLFSSPRATPTSFDLTAGAELTASVLGAVFDHAHRERRHCPPWSGLSTSIDPAALARAMTFVHKDSQSSAAELRRVAEQFADGGRDAAPVIVVVDDADEDEARALGDALGDGFEAIADPDGAIAASVGVGTWPTTMTPPDYQTRAEMMTSVALVGADEPEASV